MGILDGDDLVDGGLVPYQWLNLIKDHWRSATAPTTPIAGMIWSKTTDDSLWFYDSAGAWREITTILWGEICLVKGISADMNPGGATPVMATLYTVPAGKSCIITKVVIRNSSGNLTTASISFGFDAVGSDCITNAAHVTLTNSTFYEVIPPKVGAVRGAAAGTFKVAVNTKQGGAMTITVDVFGYLF